MERQRALGRRRARPVDRPGGARRAPRDRPGDAARLFGCPYLDRVLAAYEETAPLAGGSAGRVGVHQLFPLLVHAVLFGRGYAEQALTAARAALRPER
ncbi:fructosamine kinase family protein [Streptomyces olivaceus]|uniref:fructosamine kinase family protein n=1 Tax=Streptomyces olivaceus TaxID=47716 RepID=UPI0037B1AE4C